MSQLNDEQRAAALKAARIAGMPSEGAADIWAAGYMRGVIDGGTKVAAEICDREGHRELEVTTNGDLAQGKRVYLCGRCPTRIETTRVEIRP